MADDARFLPGLSPLAGRPVQITFDAGRLTSDGGVLVLAEIERRLGIAERLARCVEDPRASERVQHGLAAMIRFRALLIVAGGAVLGPAQPDPWEDANDCDALRADPALKMAVGWLPESGTELCSQPTMCRLELDSNPVERAIRAVALTRKNSLFAGSDRGAEHSAIAVPSIQTAKLHSLDPFAYLTDVLERRVSGRTKAHEFDHLLPWHWHPSSRPEPRQPAKVVLFPLRLP